MARLSGSFFRHVLFTLLLGLLIVGVFPPGSAPVHGDAPSEDDVQDAKGECAAPRSVHDFSEQLTIESIVSVMDDPKVELASGGVNTPDGMSVISSDDPIFCGAEWERQSWGWGLGGYCYTWFYSRAYLEISLTVPEDAFCSEAILTMVTGQAPQNPIEVFPGIVYEYWDVEVISNTGDWNNLPSMRRMNHSVTVNPGSDEKTVSIDVTDIVDGWFQGDTNRGICLSSNETMPDLGNQSNPVSMLPFFYGLGNGAKAPSLKVDYVINHAPVARITSDPVKSAIETEQLSFTGDAEDPDGDEIALYEWSSDRDGLLGCGPDLTRITVDNLSAGLHKIRLRVKDGFQEHPRWSEYSYQTVQVTENIPRVTAVTARSARDGGEDVEFSLGDTVEIVVDVDLGTKPYTGWVDIDHYPAGVPAVTGGTLSEDLVFAWNTTSETPGVYSVKVVIRDSAGKENTMATAKNDPDMIISIVDNEPPVIESITASFEGEEGFEFDMGDRITITVTAGGGETGLKGDSIVLDSRGNPAGVNPTLSDVGYGKYTALWNTDHLGGDVYTFRVYLKDGSDNLASEEIQITIIDTNDPRVVSVEAMLGSQPGESFPVATSLNVMVVEEDLEEGLTAKIDITIGSRFIVYQEILMELGDGRYYYPWNTKDHDPGVYAINVTLSDEHGNCDPDGLGRKDQNGNRLPDLMVRLTVPEATLVVTGTVPLSGQRDVSRGTMIMVTFSQPVDPATVSSDTIPVSIRDGSDIPGRWTVVPSGMSCEFDPENILEPGSNIMVEVTVSVMTFEGVSCSPYTTLFETTSEDVLVEFERSPSENIVVMNGTEDVTFTVITAGSDVAAFSWSLDDRKVPGEEDQEYVFRPEDNTSGWHRIEATPLGIEGEPVRWQVFVSGSDTGDDDGTENGDDTVVEDRKSDENPGGYWQVAVGAAVMTAGIVLLVSVLMITRKRGKNDMGSVPAVTKDAAPSTVKKG